MAIRNLRRGNTGDDVRTLQKNLQTLGYYLNDKVDGVFGSNTDAAVRQFQRANGLSVDGVVGPNTRAAIAGKLKAKAGTTVQKAAKKPVAKTDPNEIGRWGGHIFRVAPGQIYSVDDLQMKGASELKDKKESNQGEVSRKGANPYEVTLNVPLNA